MQRKNADQHMSTHVGFWETAHALTRIFTFQPDQKRNPSAITRRFVQVVSREFSLGSISVNVFNL